MSGFFIDTGETVQKRPRWSLETLWKLGIPSQVNSGFSVMIFCPIHVFLWHMESWLEDRVESVCFGLWGSPSVKDVFEILKFLKLESTSEWPRQKYVGLGPFLSPKATGKIFLIVCFSCYQHLECFCQMNYHDLLWHFVGSICSSFCPM